VSILALLNAKRLQVFCRKGFPVGIGEGGKRKEDIQWQMKSLETKKVKGNVGERT